MVLTGRLKQTDLVQNAHECICNVFAVRVEVVAFNAIQSNTSTPESGVLVLVLYGV